VLSAFNPSKNPICPPLLAKQTIVYLFEINLSKDKAFMLTA